MAAKSLMSKTGPEQRRGFAPSPGNRTLDKMMRDRTHLVSAEVDKLLEAAKSSRNAARDPGPVVPDVPARLARVGGLRAATGLRQRPSFTKQHVWTALRGMGY
jgi:hypothetical protein